MRLGVLFASAVGAVLAFGAPAVAADDIAEAEPVRVQYAVTFDDAVFGPGEEPGVYQSPTDTLVLECVTGECRIVDGWPWLDFDEESESFAMPGAFTSSSAASGSVCEGTAKGATTIDLEFAADSVTGSKHEDPMQEECASGTATHFGHVLTITSSELLTGECFFVPEGCAAAGSSEGDGGGSAPGVPASETNRAATTSSELSTAAPAAPSVLSSLATPAEAGTAPQQLALAALLTIVLVLLVAFPTSLLNSAVEQGSDRLSAWRQSRRRADEPALAAATAQPTADDAATTEPGAADPSGRRGASRTWWWAAAGVALAALISAFVDPQFGLNPGSARVLLSLLASFAVDVVLGWSVVIWLVRRVAPGVTHSFIFKPLTLVMVVAAVVFTRLTGFEPGVIFGLVAGVAFGAMAGRGQQAKAMLAMLGYAFGVAIIAWALYGLLGGGAAAGESFWQTFAVETLAAIATGGMAALPIALFPVRGMAGYSIWAWSRWLWAGCYAIGLFAFFIVLMPMPFAWAGVNWDLAAWIGVYLIYAIGAVVAWVVIARPWRHDDDESDLETPDAPAGDVEPEPSDAAQ